MYTSSKLPSFVSQHSFHTITSYNHLSVYVFFFYEYITNNTNTAHPTCFYHKNATATTQPSNDKLSKLINCDKSFKLERLKGECFIPGLTEQHYEDTLATSLGSIHEAKIALVKQKMSQLVWGGGRGGMIQGWVFCGWFCGGFLWWVFVVGFCDGCFVVGKIW